MILALLLALALLCQGSLMLCVFFSGKRARDPAPAHALVVLGARVMPDGELSTTLAHRVETALAAYRRGLAPAIILCGARGADEPVTEAQAMAAYLQENGVPSQALYLDDASESTYENLENAQAIMAQNHMDSAILVTSDYHLQRALWLAADAGLCAQGCPAPGPDLLINRLKARAREALAWVNYFLFYRLPGRAGA